MTTLNNTAASRELGYDVNPNANVSVVTSTNATINSYGAVILASTVAGTFTLTDPVSVGQTVSIATDTATASTALRTVTTAGGAGVCTIDGPTAFIANFTADAQALRLVARSTVRWTALGNTGSVTFTTV